MISTLRKSVFRSIFFSAAGVLFVIIIALNGLNLIQTAEKADRILDSAAEVMYSPANAYGIGKNRDNRHRGKSELLRSVSADELGFIQLDAEGNMTSITGVSEFWNDESRLTELISYVLSADETRGSWMNWMYRLGENSQGKLLVVLNPSSIYSEAREYMLTSILGFLAACGLFALLANSLAKRITAPVEKSMQAQKRFIADASHELKTPLTVIDANAAVLEKSIGKNKWLGYIQTESQRMSGLVTALLKLSELDEAGNAAEKQQASRFDAVESIMEIALPFESVAFEHGVSLNLELPDMMPVSGYPEDLGQIAKILLDNAIKHAEENSEVQVSLTAPQPLKGKNGGMPITLSVTNRGDTIPPEALQHIFDRFYKADASRKYSGNSYGLGLAIAKGIADQHRWLIQVESQDRQTTFSLTFPAAK
ncbi:MAG: HAMP domain-containing histidine kinase [Clostridia bacterium]|nr:HAMP domain-containing histidine kinase [Clostridia bacterium]